VLAVVTVLVTFTVGAVGVYVMRDQFSHITTVNQAIYFAFMTYSTVGYGTAYPLTTFAHYWVILMAMIGVGSFSTLLAVILGPYLENKMKEVIIMLDQITKKENHAIIAGVNSVSLQIAKRLTAQKIDVIFISDNATDIQTAKQLNYYTCLGDATDQSILKKVYLERANYLVGALESDANNIMLAMSAKSLLNASNANNDLKIITMIEKEDNVDNAKANGVSIVILPAAIVADDLFQKLNDDSMALM
jgi:voltage-gated potassium channel